MKIDKPTTSTVFVVAVQDEGVDRLGVGSVTAICAPTPGVQRYTATRLYVDDGSEQDSRERVAGQAARLVLDEALIAEGFL